MGAVLAHHWLIPPEGQVSGKGLVKTYATHLQETKHIMTTSNTAADILSSLEPSAEKKEMRLYKSRLLSCKYIFTNGVAANFVNGKYATPVESEIAELDAQIRQGHSHLYVDKDEITIDYDHTDPLAELKKKFFAEFTAQAEAAAATQAAVTAGRDLGATVHGVLKAANTTDIAPVALGNGSSKK